jgi:Family of unknown function (DUF5908)
MPIVVRELVIRARVEDVESNSGSSSSASGSNGGLKEGQIERIVALCVEKTLLAIRNLKER